jgi:hypothetical protein
VALACGPLLKPRYINLKIEEELAEFKEEILQKFTTSEMNRNYKFPLRHLETENTFHSIPATKSMERPDLPRGGQSLRRTIETDDEVQMGDVRGMKFIN